MFTCSRQTHEKGLYLLAGLPPSTFEPDEHARFGTEYEDAEEAGAPLSGDAGDVEDLLAAATEAEPPAAAGGKGQKKGKARGAQAGKDKAPAAPKTPAAKPRAGRCSHARLAPHPIHNRKNNTNSTSNVGLGDLLHASVEQWLPCSERGFCISNTAEHCIPFGCCRSAGARSSPKAAPEAAATTPARKPRRAAASEGEAPTKKALLSKVTRSLNPVMCSFR